MEIVLSRLESPIGELVLAGGAEGLVMLEFDVSMEDVERLLAKRYPGATVRHGAQPELEGPLRAYFAGEVHAIDHLPVAPVGTEFQRRVWDALRRIPCGETWTYAELARAVGQPSAMRAVGAANGKNPIAVVVPCHRVVATGGKLGGYAGGLERKAWLLRHERARLA